MGDKTRNKVLICVTQCGLTLPSDAEDHIILLPWLKFYVGISAEGLSWFQSYLTNQSSPVQLVDFFSSAAYQTCGVPQGFILSPILFLLYMLPFGQILTIHYIHLQCYTDDIQLNLPLRPIVQAALHPHPSLPRSSRRGYMQTF